jgi:hypothetical protein
VSLRATLNRLNPNQVRRLSINKQPHPSQPCWQQSQTSYRANAGERCTLREFDRYVAVDPVKAQLNIAHVLGSVAKEGHRLPTVGSTRKYVFEVSLSASGRQLYSLNQRRIVRVNLTSSGGLTDSCQKLSSWPRGGNAHAPHRSDTTGLVGDRVMDGKYASKSAPKSPRCHNCARATQPFRRTSRLVDCLTCTPSTASHVTNGMLKKATQLPTSGPITGQVWQLKDDAQGKALQIASVSGAPSLAFALRARPTATRATFVKEAVHFSFLNSAQASISAVAVLRRYGVRRA